jgi:hypothetical protein
MDALLRVHHLLHQESGLRTRFVRRHRGGTPPLSRINLGNGFLATMLAIATFPVGFYNSVKRLPEEPTEPKSDTSAVSSDQNA